MTELGEPLHRCASCDEVLPENHFYRDSPLGVLTGRCIACKKTWVKMYRLAEGQSAKPAMVSWLKAATVEMKQDFLSAFIAWHVSEKVDQCRRPKKGKARRSPPPFDFAAYFRNHPVPK